MSRPYETGKTSHQPQISQEHQNRQRMQSPEPPSLALPRLPSLTKVWGRYGWWGVRPPGKRWQRSLTHYPQALSLPSFAYPSYGSRETQLMGLYTAIEQQVAQLDSRLASLPQASLYPRLPSLTKVRARRS